jgi:hypothetical protein
VFDKVGDDPRLKVDVRCDDHLAIQVCQIQYFIWTIQISAMARSAIRLIRAGNDTPYSNIIRFLPNMKMIRLEEPGRLALLSNANLRGVFASNLIMPKAPSRRSPTKSN